jgi:hypothetical protein
MDIEEEEEGFNDDYWRGISIKIRMLINFVGE